MLYYLSLLTQMEELAFFRLFRYLTFRCGAAVVTALLIAFLINPMLIRWLKIKQGKGQPIRSDGPARHIIEKAGTPTMGGILILIPWIGATLLWANLSNPYVWIALLVATLAWSFGSIWSRGRDLAPPFMNAAAQMLCGGAAMVVAGLVTGERLHALPTPHALGAFAYLVVFGSWFGFTAYIWLLHHVRPALAGSYAYVNPAIAVALGAWLAGERFGRHELVAMGVILLGVVAITFAKAAKGKPA